MNYNNLLKLLQKRKSCRSYSSREVPENIIKNCLEAARIAPSACNKQPWKFIIVKNPESRNKLFKNATHHIHHPTAYFAFLF